MPGAYNNLQLIRGNSGICISIPNQMVIPSRVTPTELKSLERVIFGVIVHECTHVIQEKAAPAAFATALALEQNLHALGTSAEPGDWYGLYIGQPFEQEARAGQATAEVEYLGGQNLSKLDFYTLLTETEIFQRTATKIGAPGSGETKIASWWEMWMALAWDAYA